MATVTGMTADRMLAIEKASVVDGDVVGDNLILTTKGGTQIDAGSVRGPIGPSGPMGASLSVVSAKPVLDIGIINQIRGGRQLSAADFTNMGLATPLGLWNLSDLNDASGNGRSLSNKGSVPFGVGINGVAATAAVFAGSPAQCLYIPDTGAADPFRLKAGSVMTWFKSAKKGTQQYLVDKMTPAAGGYSWALQVDTNNHAYFWISTTGSDVWGAACTTDVCDDRWHQLVGTFDGNYLKIYVDGVIEGYMYVGNSIPLSAAGPLCIGGANGDAATNAASPNYGRQDETVITSDVLSDEEVRNLFCASIPHALGNIPNNAILNIRRRRRGGVLASADFPIQPVRLHNFTAGALADEGSSNTPLTLNPGTGSIVPASGADGVRDGAYLFRGAHGGLTSNDAGCPVGLSSRSFGMWIKNSAAGTMGLFQFGVTSTGEARIDSYGASANTLRFISNADVVNPPNVMFDGQWHHVCEVDDNAAADGLRRKIYYDGRLVGSSTVMNPITLAGATGFRIGHAAGSAYGGEIDGLFLVAGALTAEQVRAVYNKGSQQLAPSPKSSGDHIEALEIGRLLATFDNIEATDMVDLAVMS